MKSTEEPPSDCPLCMEAMDLSDQCFFPCTCGYQICRFCWHHIRNELNGLCPACRREYEEQPVEFKPLTTADIQEMKAQKKKKGSDGKHKEDESRKHLQNVRVIQRNLVYVIGLSLRIAEEETLRKPEFFGLHGKILKVVVNKNNAYNSAGASGPTVSAYITYSSKGEALAAIQAVDGAVVDGRILRASFGTTKYCTHFLRNVPCPNPECMYLHELGEEVTLAPREDAGVSASGGGENADKFTEDFRRNEKSLPSFQSFGNHPQQQHHQKHFDPNFLDSEKSNFDPADASSALPSSVSWASKSISSSTCAPSGSPISHSHSSHHPSHHYSSHHQYHHPPPHHHSHSQPQPQPQPHRSSHEDSADVSKPSAGYASKKVASLPSKPRPNHPTNILLKRPDSSSPSALQTAPSENARSVDLRPAKKQIPPSHQKAPTTHEYSPHAEIASSPLSALNPKDLPPPGFEDALLADHMKAIALKQPPQHPPPSFAASAAIMDDDFDFDPFQESAKGLADLLDSTPDSSLRGLAPGDCLLPHPNPPACWQSPPNPPFHFSPSSLSSRAPPGIEASASFEMLTCGSPQQGNVKDWQEGLRALFPNVNISFSAAPTLAGAPLQPQLPPQPHPSLPSGPAPKLAPSSQSPYHSLHHPWPSSSRNPSSGEWKPHPRHQPLRDSKFSTCTPPPSSASSSAAASSHPPPPSSSSASAGKDPIFSGSQKPVFQFSPSPWASTSLESCGGNSLYPNWPSAAPNSNNHHFFPQNNHPRSHNL